MTDPQSVATAMKVLSVPARVRIVQLLKGRALCVGALAARLQITQGAVSQHLRILRDAGLLTAERRGYYVHYRLNEAALARWKARMDTALSVPTGSRRPCPPALRKKGPPKCPKRRKRKPVRSPRR